MKTVRVVTAALVISFGQLAALPTPTAIAQPAPVATDTPGVPPNMTPVGSPTIETTTIESDEPFEGGAPVIPSGQEELLAEMFGRGLELPGGCKFTGGGADPAAIHGNYACAGGEIVVELRHPSTAPSGALQTAQFAVVVRSGTPPAGFLESLATRIREREAAFHWKWLGRPTGRGTRRMVLVAAGALVALAVVVVLWRRRAAGRPTPR